MSEPVDLESLDRKGLQDLAKEHGIKANGSSEDLRSALTQIFAAGPAPSKKRKIEAQAQTERIQPEDTAEAAPNTAQPFANFRFVITGTFPTSSDMIERRIVALGGAVVKAVNKSTTHVMLGENGTTDYGGQTGTGSKKYKDAKKMKCTVLKYAELQSAEAAAPPSASASVGSSQSLLQGEWDALLAAIAQGASAGLWPAPVFPAPATQDSIAALEAKMGYRIGGYIDLLLLCDGLSWYADVNGQHVSVSFGGTGDSEDDILHAFNYSGDYGRKHFKQKKQVPMQMLDYDFCVNVFEVQQGRVMQDDRECEVVRLISPSLSAWLRDLTDEVLAIVSDPPPKASAAPDDPNI